MNDKKKANVKQTPEHIIRCGEVTAEIHLRQSNAGYPYRDFVLTRTWNSMSTGHEARGSSFFDRNEQDIIQAVRETVTWIRQHLQPAVSNPAHTNSKEPVQ
jgi:hypothetical protein